MLGPDRVYYAVVTDIDCDARYDGVLCFDGKQVYVDCPHDSEKQECRMLGFAKTLAFGIGEILVLDRVHDREVNGAGRKPSKWFISYEVYEKFEWALERAQEVSANEVLPPPSHPTIYVQDAAGRKQEIEAQVEIMKNMTDEELQAHLIIGPIVKAVQASDACEKP